MAPGALQLFPPPEKPMQRPPPSKWPVRSTSRKEPSRLQVPNAPTERMEGAKSQRDFHELIIRVNSAPNSPVELQQLAHIEPPQKAHLANPKTPPQQTDPAFDSSPINPKNRASPADSGAFIPVSQPAQPLNSSTNPFRRKAAPPNILTTPSERRVASPAPSDPVSVQRDGLGSPYQDPNSIIGLAISPENQMSPGRVRISSPVQSDVMSARSGSPSLARSHSVTSKQSAARPATEEPMMRSIFPRYNPDVPLSQQFYTPMITNPPSRIPREHIHRPLNSPKYTPHGNIESIEDDGPAPRVSAAIPYYTPPTAFDSLWDATNGQGTPLVQVYTLQMHRIAATTSNEESQLIFGPSESQPFYTLSHTDLGTDLLSDDEGAADHELLITRHNPSKPTSFPISHFALSPTPSTSKSTSPSPISAQELPALITTIYPKMAALSALEIAANSPAASHIASFDPDASSPAAERLAQDVLLGSAQREACSLVWTKGSTYHQPHSSASPPGTYTLHHPSLGIFPITHEGDNGPGLSPLLGPSPFTSSRRRPTLSNRPIRISIINPFANAPNPEYNYQSGTSTPNDDVVLARLDFGSDCLVLNVASIMQFGNACFIDVLVSTLLAVALAEEKRVRREMRFEAPPTTPASRVNSSNSTNKATADKDKKKPGFWSRVGKRAENKARSKIRIDSAIDLEAWPGTQQRKGNTNGELEDNWNSYTNNGRHQKGNSGEQMPFVTTAILGILTFTFKVVIWVLSVALKIVGGLVIKISHWTVHKA